MTKKDYELIGGVFKQEITSIERLIVYGGKNVSFLQDRLWILMRVINKLATEFALSDPKFNRAKFLQACGIETESFLERDSRKYNR